MGGMGYAFVANAKPGLGAAGTLTYAGWNPERAFELGENLGFSTGRVNARKGDADFAARPQEAWDGIRTALDAGYACYGFKMQIPEYSTIHGYDDVGYLLLRQLRLLRRRAPVAAVGHRRRHRRVGRWMDGSDRRR